MVCRSLILTALTRLAINCNQKKAKPTSHSSTSRSTFGTNSLFRNVEVIEKELVVFGVVAGTSPASVLVAREWPSSRLSQLAVRF